MAGGSRRARGRPGATGSARGCRSSRSTDDPPGTMIRVLLADDHVLVRTGFRMILRAEPDMEVVGEAADGAQAVDGARRLRPDVVVMDVRMPRVDGLEAARQVLALPDRPPRMLMLTTFDLDEYVFEALRAGASGFLL